MNIGTKGNRRPLTAADFEKQLDQQLTYLRRSCATFDEGFHDEAPRIATTIRVLVHDTKSSTSLLTHLGLKNSLNFVDTGVYRPAYRAALEAEIAAHSATAKICAESPSEVGLVEPGQVGDGPVRWYAPLVLMRWRPGTPPHNATKGISTFSDWWDTPLVESSTGKSFSRAHLVKIMANQDGGAHVDAEIDADYADLCIDPLGSQIMVSKSPIPEGAPIPDVQNNVAFASVRQIAFELLLTLGRWKAIRKPGAALLANPFADIPMPTPPHKPLGFSPSIILGSV